MQLPAVEFTTTLARLLKTRSLLSPFLVFFIAAPCLAQITDTVTDEGDIDDAIDEIIITGTRIKNENIVAASPVATIDLEEIGLKQNPTIERLFRDLPITIPGDGENVNNGSLGQATVNLRALGPGRSLILIDGKRLAPFDFSGVVSTHVIPVNMLERIDVVTGGASTVYGTDAMSGAINFVLQDDFEGFELELGYSATDSAQAINGGGDTTTYTNVLFGLGSDDDRGHIVIGGGYTDRGAILQGQRTFGLWGVSSFTGAGMGAPPAAPAPDCSGNTEYTVAQSTFAGSPTSIPATLDLRSGSRYQFRNDMSIAPFTGPRADTRCSRFNFNPFNYYQTPQERWQATTVASYDVSDHVELYARASFSANESLVQIAPSGTFGQPFTIPVMNPFFSDATRTTIMDDLNTGAMLWVTNNTRVLNDLLALPNPTPDDLDTIAALQAMLAADPLGFGAVGIQDLNSDGVFDTSDAFTSTARRRTLELGPRIVISDTDYYQIVVGARGALPTGLQDWNYDVSYQHGESDYRRTWQNFTNLTNLQAGINTVDPDRCITADGALTPAPCTPINVFGPLGSITEAQNSSGFFTASGTILQKLTQSVLHASVDGRLERWSLPTANDGISVAFGVEFSDLAASADPDECMKLAPRSCLGGAGGNFHPLAGGYSSDEWFFEAIMPLVQGKTGFDDLSLEAGYRGADYDVQGSTDSWKAGISWQVVPGFRIRFMEQQAVRVPNVRELFSPITNSFDYALFDPCSIGNPDPPVPGSELFDLCVNAGTGMLPSQVGNVPDLDNFYIPTFLGSNPNALPDEEQASTTTFGFVWEPGFSFLPATTVSVDYYDITIDGYIGTPSGSEMLDLCYVFGDPVACSGVVRSGGAFGEAGTGVATYIRNLLAYQAEGIDLMLNTGFEAGSVGDFRVSVTAHRYLTNRFQTTAASPVTDCKGYYGSCDPVPEFRSTFRINWYRDNLNASLLWRHIGRMDADPLLAERVFPEFASVGAQNYLDVNFGFAYEDWGRVSLLVNNVLDKDPPILGNGVGSVAFNNGNTFPSLFDAMGRVYSIRLVLTL